MNLFTTKLRRGATVAGGGFLGLGIIAAMATPAAACDVKIKPSSECGDNGGWVAKFEVANDWHPEAKITSVKLDGVEQAVGDIKVDTIVGKDYSQWLVGTVEESASKESAELSVTMLWTQGDWSDTDTTVKKAYKPKDTDCKPDNPNPSPSTSSPSPSASATTSTPPTEETTSPSGSPSATPTDTPTVPIPTPSETTEPVLPDEIFAADCDSMTIGLDNTKGEIEYKLHFTPKTGAEKDLDIKAGEKKSLTFDATKGFSVKISIVAVYKGVTSPAETVTVPYEAPANCGGQGGGDELAKTGTPTAGIAGGAAALLAVGGGLFYMARRRKVKFTA